MNKLTLFLLSGTLLFASVACADGARTSGDAPSTVEEGAQVDDPTEVEATQDDATSEVRREQLDADIRAREERDEVFGDDDQARADSDLESQVRAKLEANITQGQLTVEAENGSVIIVGTVPNQQDYDSIVPLAQEIRGVNEVILRDVKVVPPAQS
ncbi:MAG: BON domain-containing protein [Pleurocapsa sp.]